MNQKYFKYESKNHKKIRVKDILMLLSIFTLCIITVIATGTSVNKNKLKVQTTVDNKVYNTPENYDKSEYLLDSNKINNIIKEASDEVENTELSYEFICPVEGGIVKPFSPDNLIYNETMDDWRTHMGVDISCVPGSDVIACERGYVKLISYDINYGTTVTVQCGDYDIIYTSLSSELMVEEGQNISKGEIIGKYSENCMSEICDVPHIHFEVKKGGVYVNPVDVIKFN